MREAGGGGYGLGDPVAELVADVHARGLPADVGLAYGDEGFLRGGHALRLPFDLAQSLVGGVLPVDGGGGEHRDGCGSRRRVADEVDAGDVGPGGGLPVDGHLFARGFGDGVVGGERGHEVAEPARPWADVGVGQGFGDPGHRIGLDVRVGRACGFRGLADGLGELIVGAQGDGLDGLVVVA